ncbi:MAG: Inner membrane ABC transporter permease protein YcjP [Spirochaetes bacterium ADurb.Bin315]|nr:MAG: Inner membrane ABC transporter permease protein YcjP [Spirochaetes bacterium ADurb.Bin315]
MTGKRIASRVVLYLMVILVSIIITTPFVIMLSYSFRTSQNIFSLKISLIPENPTIAAYKNAIFKYKFSGHGFGKWTINSLLTCGVATFVSIFVAAMCGYAISRFKFTGKRFLWFLIAITQTIPWIVILIPYYITASKLKLVNNLSFLSLTYTAVFLPTSAWLFIGFFNNIPYEIEEAAKIDGCSTWGIFLRIIIPLSIASISAIALVAFVTGWSDYLFASVFLKRASLWTLPLGLTSFRGEHQIQWAEIMAMSTLVTVPIVVLFVYLQKYLVDLMAGGVKQ